MIQAIKVSVVRRQFITFHQGNREQDTVEPAAMRKPRKPGLLVCKPRDSGMGCSVRASTALETRPGPGCQMLNSLHGGSVEPSLDVYAYAEFQAVSVTQNFPRPPQLSAHLLVISIVRPTILLWNRSRLVIHPPSKAMPTEVKGQSQTSGKRIFPTVDPLSMAGDIAGPL